MRTATRLAAEVVAGAGLATALLLVLPGPGSVAEQRAERYGGAGDRVTEAVAGMLEDRVHVPADGRAMMPPAAEARVSAAIVERDLPVYVTVWEPSWFAGYEHPIQAAEQMAWALGEETGEPALVVLWQGPDDGYLEATPGHRWAPEGASYEQERPQFLGEAGTRLTEWVTGLPTGSPDASLFAASEAGSTVGGVTSGVLAGLTVTAVLAAIALAVTTVRGRSRRT